MYFHLVTFIAKTTTLHWLTILFIHGNSTENIFLTSVNGRSCVICMMYDHKNVHAFLETHNRSAQTLINTHSVSQEQMCVSSYKKKNKQKPSMMGFLFFQRSLEDDPYETQIHSFWQKCMLCILNASWHYSFGVRIIT